MTQYSKTFVYILTNTFVLISVYKRNMIQLWRASVLLFCAAFIFMLFMLILQVAAKFLNQNGINSPHKPQGSGKLPITPPHTHLWYEIEDYWEIFTYVVGGVSAFESLLGGLMVGITNLEESAAVNESANEADIREVLCNEENQEQFKWETSVT